MEIGKILQNWFVKTYDNLDKHFRNQNVKSKLEETVNSSVSIVKNYTGSIIKLLQPKEHVLPAKALLRCLYQLISRITWILMGENEEEKEIRLKSLEKESLKQSIQLYEKILKVVKNEDTLSEYTSLLNKKEFYNQIKALPEPTTILKEVFGNEYPLIPIFEWSGLNMAIHPDYLALHGSILKLENSILYSGDIKEDINILKFRSCICIHRYFKEIYKFYGFNNFEEIDNEFKELCNYINK